MVTEAVKIVLDQDKQRKLKNEKQYKQELKKEEKEAKRVAKLQAKNRTSVSMTPESSDKGKQPETAS